ncbi:MAG: hypothetical protein P8X74_11785 [Reinekea sp.]
MKRLVVLSLACLLSATALSVDAKPSVIGEAYDPESGRLLYREEHRFYSATKHEVLYQTADGEVFANKQLDYSRSDMTPAFSMTNQWSGETIDIQWQNSDLTGRYVSRLKEIERGLKTIAISRSEPLVIDAGFDGFIRHNWTQLMTGQRIVFEYIIPTRLVSVPLAIQLTHQEAERYQFTINAKSRLLNLFVQPIVLQYNSQRSLVMFNGRSNIADHSGQYLDVVIHFHTVE